MKYPQLVSMPSAVSDWLEEQLEARGIDAVVYTRYVLSLLYRDPVDVICPDQDFHIANPTKEVRRSGGGRKRFRRSTEWWAHHAQADADQLKRSAAVECLMSASDQKCGIESLVDELCEKLKEVDSQTAVKSESSSSEKNSEVNQLSPQDSAKRYYAAFPPLSRNSRPSSPLSYIALIPKWLGSPKKKTKRQFRSSSYEEKFHCKIESDSMKLKPFGKQRYGYFSRNKKDLGYCRNVAKSMERSESMNDWDLYMFKNNAKTMASNNWPNLDKGPLTEKDIHARVLGNLSENVNSRESTEELWTDTDDNVNMYDDLPVDIRQLLNSPIPQEENVELMNVADRREIGNHRFLPFNIVSSIWSSDAPIWSSDAPMEDTTSYENNFNSAIDEDQPSEELLDLRFSSISIDSTTPSWTNTDAVVDNERNSFYENLGNESAFSSNFNFDSSPWGGVTTPQKWSDGEGDLEMLERSLTKINHNKDKSSFVEVLPRPNRGTYEVFNTRSTSLKISIQTVVQKGEVKSGEKKESEDDLLLSDFTHFRPINEKLENRLLGKYANGTTFLITSTLDPPDYKRSDSGGTYLDDEFGESKKYQEYKKNYSLKDFILKFSLSLNDKSSQTDSDSPSPETSFLESKTKDEEDLLFPGDAELLLGELKSECTCSLNNEMAMKPEFSFGNDSTCLIHAARPDSMMAEIFGKDDGVKCDNCNNNSWNAILGNGTDLDTEYNKKRIQNIWNGGEKDIWNGGEFCRTCLGLSRSKPRLSIQQYRLRQDVRHDGEKLLSDLSNFQKTLMDELPVSELSCDISELLGAGERKRRHSSMNGTSVEDASVPDASFSFATRLEEDVLITMTAIPTLRSVTL